MLVLTNIFELMQQDQIKIFDFTFSVILVILINCFIFWFVKRKLIRIIISLTSIAYIITSIFLLDSTSFILFGVITIVSLLALFVNMAETRYLFANKMSIRKLNKKAPEVEKIFDHESLYKTINETVLYLSKNKIGGLITFERKDKLKDIIKNGSYLDAPVTFELLITIFYPGTRLHDGAVVIRGNTILAASVYYTPSTKPLIGKYGSRHRAAIGISDICDAITVVVSEETGRISIAYNGELESFTPETFYNSFVNMMSETDVLSADSSRGGKELEE